MEFIPAQPIAPKARLKNTNFQCFGPLGLSYEEIHSFSNTFSSTQNLHFGTSSAIFGGADTLKLNSNEGKNVIIEAGLEKV